ncbi:MAG: heavy-metal-associated domain-containing protein [Chitinophagaceae bacterium]|jgi:copper chaperone CopZ|nr:heavy-metal-associated domain-containing protein [Chitinophagaceae bacterium]
MKKILFIIAIAISMITTAQVNSVSLQASGLTCSMCSNAINKALRTLDFVLDVDADIKTYTFKISFKPNSVIDFDKIRKKVVDAGFTVYAFIADIYFNNVQVRKELPVIVQDKKLLFINAGDQVLSGNKQVKILDKGFVSPKEYKKNEFPDLALGTFHVSL